MKVTMFFDRARHRLLKLIGKEVKHQSKPIGRVISVEEDEAGLNVTFEVYPEYTHLFGESIYNRYSFNKEKK